MNKVIIVPGNGNTDVYIDNWYAWVKKELEKNGVIVMSENMPDPELARKEYWLPFIKEKLQADENTIFIGHSSGAVAGMKFAEENKLAGLILVGACYTDLGDANEKASGYFDNEWQWKKIKENCGWVAQFAGLDDPSIPIEESRFIHEQLNTEYYELPNKGHFNSVDFKELVDVVLKKVM